jgi:O-antigen/teichoic acid export membrane protein
MTGLVVVLDLWWLRGRLRVDLRTTTGRMLTMARASLPYWAFGLFFMVYLWIDFVMLSLLTRNEVVGWYAVPTRLFQTLMFFPVVVATAWLPRFVRAFEADREQLGREARPPTELVLLLSLPIASLTILAAHPLIHLLYGADYAESVPVMVGLGLCIPAMYLNIMMAQVLIAMNRQAVWTWVMAGTVVINPLFNLALIPFTQHHYDNGAIGASISLLLTELVCVGAGYVLIGRLVFDWGSVRRTVLGLGIAGAMWGVGYWIDSMGPAVLALIAAGLTFVLLAWLLRLFSTEEVELMRAGLAKMRNKVPGLKRNVAEAALEAPPTS